MFNIYKLLLIVVRFNVASLRLGGHASARDWRSGAAATHRIRIAFIAVTGVIRSR